MKNRTTLVHGLLSDFERFLKETGWTIQETKGPYEVLRAVRPGRKGPLLVHNRTSGGCGYSIDERDMNVYKKWHQDRKKRGLDPFNPATEEEKKERKEVIKTLR